MGEERTVGDGPDVEGGAPAPAGPVPRDLVPSDPVPSDIVLSDLDAITDVDAWRRALLGLVAIAPLAEEVPTARAAGRILAHDVRAPEHLPSGPISAMDGFAVRWADLSPEAARTELPVALDLPARRGGVPALPPGHAARIMTGAPLPDGADTVVEIERTDAEESGSAPRTVRLLRTDGLALGRHVRGAGEEVRRGDVLARTGDRVGPGLLALLTTLGVRTVPVRRPPAVGVLVTGDELVDAPGGPSGAALPLDPGEVRESNGAMLLAALADLGIPGETARSGDDPIAFLAALEALAERSDLVITSGGIGHGAYDVVKRALGPDGRGTSRFAHLHLRPGGPQGAGRLRAAGREVSVIHLPGTPVGALVGFHLFVRPVLIGEEPSRPVRAQVLSVEGAQEPARRSHREGTLALPGRLARTEDGALGVRLLAGRRLAPYGRADCIVLAGGEPPAPGADVPVLAL